MILIEDTWNIDGEANDIIKWCTDHQYDYRIMTQDELRSISDLEFKNSIYFCHTDIVREHNIPFPDTYEDKYKSFMKRKINTMRFDEFDFDNIPFPIFIKPIGNDKSFDGTIVSNEDQYATDVILNTYPKPVYIYTSEVIKFVSEYRLLIGNKKLYGRGRMIGKVMKLDNSFINELIEITDTYRCIDIGYSNEMNTWMVVEINPPFSLDDYEIDIDSYMNFCIDACIYTSTKM